MFKLSALRHTNKGTNPTIDKIISEIINKTISKTAKTHKTKATVLEIEIQMLALIIIEVTINVLIKATAIGVTIVKAVRTTKINPICLIPLSQINSAKRRKSNAKILIFALFAIS